MSSEDSGEKSRSAGRPHAGDPHPPAVILGPGPSATASGAARSLGRLRKLRALLSALAIVLLLYVGWSIWSRRPARIPAAAQPPSQALAPKDTVQTLDRFEFTSTILGRRDYSISADRLRGIEGGVHVLEGIRSVEFLRPDGRSLKGGADHGTFSEPKPGSESAKGRLVLEGKAWFVGPGGEGLESDRLEYSQPEGTILSPGQAHLAFRGASGEAGRLEYNLAAQTIRLDDGVTLRLAGVAGPDTVLTARKAVASADGRSADLTGDVSIVRGEETVSGPSLHLDRAEGGNAALCFVLAGPAKGRIVPAPRAELSHIAADSAPASSGGAPGPGSRGSDGKSMGTEIGGRPFLLSAERIEGRDTGSGGRREIVLAGDASVVEEGEDIRATSSAAPDRAATVSRDQALRRLEADHIAVSQDHPGGARSMTAEGNVWASIPVPGRGGTQMKVAPTISCSTLMVRLSPLGAIEGGEAHGEVRIEAEDGVATAGQLTLIGETIAELRGGRPRLAQGERVLIADEIDLDQSAGTIRARGSVLSRFIPESRRTSGPFAPGEAVEIVSDRALLKRNERTGEFEGSVLARQADRALGAASLFLDDSQTAARASGNVRLRTFRFENADPQGSQPAVGPAAERLSRESGNAQGSQPAGGAAPGRLSQESSAGANARGGPVIPPASEPAKAPRRGPVRVPVQISADTLVYDGKTDTTRFEGHALYTEPGRTLSAQRITTLGGGEGNDAKEVTAEGAVTVEGEGRKGTADSAYYRASDRTLTLSGRERPANIVETATGRSWRGPSLTWVLTADSIPIVSGESGRSSVVGPAAPSGAGIGKQALGRKPR